MVSQKAGVRKSEKFEVNPEFDWEPVEAGSLQEGAHRKESLLIGFNQRNQNASTSRGMQKLMAEHHRDAGKATPSDDVNVTLHR